ncbi:MAG TPA: hypothetical protein VFK07_00105, partial [Candidatus Paceibacterota bacterium]|nr:hypothetical protein [Candidatus Paceibacterota bacterium]
MLDNVLKTDLNNLRGGQCPPGMPLYDTEQIYELCMRWASLQQWSREGIISQVRPLIIDKKERQIIIRLLAGKY